MSRTPPTLDKVREAIRERQDRQRSISRQYRSRAEVEARLVETVALWGATAQQEHVGALAACADGKPPEFLTVNAAAETASGTVIVSVPLGPTMVQLLGPALVLAAMRNLLDSVPVGLSPADKTKVIAQLESEVEALSVQEEGLLRAAWDAGDVIDPRPDADPRHALTWRPVQ